MHAREGKREREREDEDQLGFSLPKYIEMSENTIFVHDMLQKDSLLRDKPLHTTKMRGWGWGVGGSLCIVLFEDKLSHSCSLLQHSHSKVQKRPDMLRVHHPIKDIIDLQGNILKDITTQRTELCVFSKVA